MGGGSDVLFPNVTSVEMGENTGGNGEWSEQDDLCPLAFLQSGIF